MTKHARLVVGAVALAAVILFVSTQVLSQEKPGQPPAGDWEQMMAKWKEMNAKGPEHERFKDMVGPWETVTKSWMAPNAEPMVSKGMAHFRLILDGRYVEQKYRCDTADGVFEGLGLEGYDRFKQKYVSIWMDNMSTGIYMSLGTVDETGKVFTYYGKMDDPMTGQKDKVVKSVARVIDDDHVVFEMYDKIPDVGEFKNMEIVYTRKK